MLEHRLVLRQITESHNLPIATMLMLYSSGWVKIDIRSSKGGRS